jgi:FixJ family two-component response regulator
MKAGAFHFVEKPIDAETLLATVEEALSRIDKGRDVQRESAELRARYALLTKRSKTYSLCFWRGRTASSLPAS